MDLGLKHWNWIHCVFGLDWMGVPFLGLPFTDTRVSGGTRCMGVHLYTQYFGQKFSASMYIYINRERERERYRDNWVTSCLFEPK